MHARSALLLLATICLPGCQSVPRRPAPPQLISAARPPGFPADVRLITTDRQGFESISPGFLSGIRAAAGGGPINILALSGGGANGAFGAGALAGLTRAHARPEFEMVTGVSAGALLAPFAFLGPRWDAVMREAFTGKLSAHLLRSPRRSLVARLLFPRGRLNHGALFELVDHYVTPQMIRAIADQARRGRRLIVATTDLDKRETVLWDMSVIAMRGGEPARTLFRDVLMASASVPGVFPPVMIHVRDGDIHYDEMHVDGGVTSSVFALPLIVGVQGYALPQLRGAHLFMIVNGQLAAAPSTTPFKTMTILSDSFEAEMTYKTRGAISEVIAATQRLGMSFRMTELPADYPSASFIDFRPSHMRALFDYAAGCAAQGLLWVTPEQSIRRNMTANRAHVSRHPACPAQIMLP